MTTSKQHKLAFLLFSLACLIAIGVCLICDFAINKSVVWSGYPLAGVLFGWLVIFPAILAGRHRLLFYLASLTVTVFPFLFVLESFTHVKGWFIGLAAPIAVIAVISCWIMFFVYKLFKVNKWFLSAVAMFLFGIVVATSADYYVSRFLNKSIFSLDNIISFFSCAAITILLVIIGISKQRGSHGKNE